MTGVQADELTRVGAAVTDLVERVFAAVEQVHAAALQALVDPAPRGPGPAIGARAEHLLQAPDQLAVGLGLVVAPRPDWDQPLGLHWWQLDPAGGRPVQLDPDLRPASLGYYDYTAAEWFAVPRRTGRRHVVGPYVDVHGTGRYLLTFTGPVVADGEFVGVVGADVPASRFETHLLRVVGPVRSALLLVGDEDRVVLSTSPRWLVGELLRPGSRPSGPGAALAAVPWRLHLVDRT